MKKTLAIMLLVVILTFGLVACGKDEEKNGGEMTNTSSTQTDVSGITNKYQIIHTKMWKKIQ